MKEQPTEAAKIEEARIQVAYAKRKGNTLYSWFNPGHVYMIQERERRMLIALKQLDFISLNTLNILEVGCGNGFWLREFIKWGAIPQNITGVDLLADRVALARKLTPEQVRIECGSAIKLEFPDGCFDLVLQSTLFSSVLDPSLRQQIASEMLRMVKADGAILWYDFHMNNPRNSDVQGINKWEIFRLFPNCQIDLSRITLAPPLSRLLAPYSLLLCYLLEQCKILNTHYLGIIRKL